MLVRGVIGMWRRLPSPTAGSRRVFVMGVFGCCIFMMPGAGQAAPKSNEAIWKQLLAKADKLEQSKSRSNRLKAAALMMQAYKLAPKKMRSLTAAARACLLRAMHSKKGKITVAWGRRGLRYAKQLISRWPSRAEGHFWASVNYGQYARGGGVWVAITKGLAGKIEKSALKSFKRNPRLYKGAAQRVLGRYYYRLPWPMRRLNKSLRYLEHAYKLFPKHTGNQFYLAETLWAKGKKSRAVRLYRMCARARHATTNHAHTGIRCHKWLKKHGK